MIKNFAIGLTLLSIVSCNKPSDSALAADAAQRPPDAVEANIPPVNAGASKGSALIRASLEAKLVQFTANNKSVTIPLYGLKGSCVKKQILTNAQATEFNCKTKEKLAFTLVAQGGIRIGTELWDLEITVLKQQYSLKRQRSGYQFSAVELALNASAVAKFVGNCTEDGDANYTCKMADNVSVFYVQIK